MKVFFLFCVSLVLLIPSCSFPTADDVEQVDALTSIYARAIREGDAKALAYALDVNFPGRTKELEQLRYRSMLLSSVSFFKHSFQVTDSSLLARTITGKMVYTVSYTEKGQKVPTVKQDRVALFTFRKGRRGWKISKIVKVKGSGTVVPQDVVRAVWHALDTRIAALNNKDIALMEAILSSRMPKRAQVIDDLKKSLHTFKDIVYVLDNRMPVRITAKKAEVVQRYALRITLPDGTTQKMPGMVERLTLESTDTGEWVITGGLGDDDD